jgi:hypothetical protein
MADQRQGEYNPEFMESSPNRTIQDNPNHPTSPSSPLSAEAQAGSERFGSAQNPYVRGPSDLPPGDTPPSDAAGGSSYEREGGDEEHIVEGEQDEGRAGTAAWLIAKAHELYTTSTDYLDANITNQWERTLSHFNNEHAPHTNFRRQDFRRTRVFRPKTRAFIKASEAALTVAAFSTQDVVDIQADDDRDEMQRLSAEVNKEILSYRLDRRMPWFQTVVGAWQSTKVYGLCISFQYWRYWADTSYEPAFDNTGSLMKDEAGNALGTKASKVRFDDMVCDNIAPENFRFDPMCDWRDPVMSSPYLVYMMPIYAGEALERMEMTDPKTGQPVWMKHALGSLLATRRKNYDRTRQAREGRERIDPADEQHGNAYTTLWAHMNIVRVNGEDMMWWTMGTELLLTWPVKVSDAFPHLGPGERPFTVGFSTIEAFRNYPAGDAEQSAGLQEELNIIANQRLDNVKLVLNKRYYVRRGSQVDLDALVRNVPGGGVMMNDPEKDVQTVNTPDITGSSYQEQDRLAVEMDELVGSFSPGSVQSNKNLNETVGGISMVQQTAGSVQDYGLRIFFETWMEPALKQLVKLIQFYETDQTILTLAAKKSQMWLRFGISELTDEILRQDLTVRVNVGIGNTDPVRRVERLIFGVTQAASLPGMVGRVKGAAITDEIFGALGYKDSSRFFMGEEEWEQFQQAQADPPPDPQIVIKREELQFRREDNQLRHQRELMRLDMEAQLGFARLALEKDIPLQKLYAELGIKREEMQLARDTTATRENVRLLEVDQKRRAAASRPAAVEG